MLVGERFTARVTFPDPGLYWYHPHIREDYGQETGALRQRPGRACGPRLLAAGAPRGGPDARRHPARGRQGGAVQPRQRRRTSAMGRFGDVLLVSGETDLSLSAKHGEVVRFYLTNTANTRVFKVALPGARMKLVGGDSGHVEHEAFVDDVVLAPSERVVVDVLFDQSGELGLEHHTPDRVYPLAAITVSQEQAEPSLAEQFERLRTQRRHGRPYGRGSPRTSRRSRTRSSASSPRWIWVCRRGMGPSSTRARCILRWSATSPSHCPECGMKLLAVEAHLHLPDAPRRHSPPSRATARNAG